MVILVEDFKKFTNFTYIQQYICVIFIIKSLYTIVQNLEQKLTTEVGKDLVGRLNTKF